MQQPDKRDLRRLKREIKQAGNQRRRRQLNRDLAENPDEAHLSESDFGRLRSSTMNGLDRKPSEDQRPGAG